MWLAAVLALFLSPAPSPAPGEPIARSPAAVAVRLAEVDARLRPDIGAWLASGLPQPPQQVTLEALYEQRVYRHLARHPQLARASIALMPGRLRPAARDTVAALRALFRLTSAATERRFRTGPPTPHADLRRFYGEAQRRFGVRWDVLAAVNFIESNFGRLRNVSNAGAVGPMQFIPSTWAAYGMGGDIRDPHDAILGAANYLHASGAPGTYARALFHYNPSPLYVRAVLRYAQRMRRDPVAFYAYWSWQSFMRTRSGDVRLTGPGR
jgi:membrane-bound lytic murein transglycosylase B